jgi:hypothetical protein
MLFLVFRQDYPAFRGAGMDKHDINGDRLKVPHKAVPITIYRNQCGDLDGKNKQDYFSYQALHMEPLSGPAIPVYPV